MKNLVTTKGVREGPFVIGLSSAEIVDTSELYPEVVREKRKAEKGKYNNKFMQRKIRKFWD